MDRERAYLFSNKNEFIITIEVVPPQDNSGDDVLEKKVAAGCRFVVTQPVYDKETAKTMFSGACIMPPFDRYEILKDIL
jgi:hypothetical protein